MTWQEAVVRSPSHVARRTAQRDGETVVWRRFADGHADCWFRGRVREADPREVESFDDWIPEAG